MILYARSRGIPVLLSTLLALVLATWWCADWMLDSPRFGGAGARVPVITLAALLAGSAVASSLHAHAAEVEGAAARRLGRWRAGQVVVGAALFGGVLAATVLPEPAHFGAEAMIRNVLGTTGLAALSAVAFGARLGWLLPLAYTGAVYLAAPRTHTGASTVWAWPVQPGPQVAAWLTAGVLFAVGVAGCGWRAPRVVRGEG